MGTFKINDHFDEDPRLAPLGPLVWGVWFAVIAYAVRNRTGGFIPKVIAEGIGGSWELVGPPASPGYKSDIPPPPGHEDDRYRELIWTIGRTSGYVGDDMDTLWVLQVLINAGLVEEVGGGFKVMDFDQYVAGELPTTTKKSPTANLEQVKEKILGVVETEPGSYVKRGDLIARAGVNRRLGLEAVRELLEVGQIVDEGGFRRGRQS